MAILSRDYLRRLVRKNHAREEGLTYGPEYLGGQTMVIVSRLDTCETCHYPATKSDEKRLAS